MLQMKVKAVKVSNKANITCDRCIIWSWISDTRGEITNVIPGQIRAGSCEITKFKRVNSYYVNHRKFNLLILTRNNKTKNLASKKRKKRYSHRINDVSNHTCENHTLDNWKLRWKNHKTCTDNETSRQCIN